MIKDFLSRSLFVLLVSTGLFACNVLKSRTFDYDYLFITKQGIIQRPLMADIEVGKKVSYTRTYKNVMTEMARQNIIEEFITSNQADLIIQPMFSVNAENTSTKSTVTITLTGFVANYKNFRPYEPKDKELLLPKEYFVSPVNYPARSSFEGILSPLKKNKQTP